MLKQKSKHSPRKAALFSTILPGAGQAYNKKYWKMPIIYAGFAGLGYAIQFNQSRYTKYRDAYKYRIDGDVSTIDDYTNIYTDENLNTLQQYYHRFRDLSIVGAVALYVLNIVDASVDAHLYTFDVSDNLSLNIQPSFINTAHTNNPAPGIALQLKF